jgi:hypothetical protein
MLWQKYWREGQWRFLIGLIVLICSAGSVVLSWPAVQQLMPAVSNMQGKGQIAAWIREILPLEREYRGYVWVQWFRQNLPQLGTLFAVLLGAGGLVSQSSREGAALFTLSMPVSRNRLIGVRAAIGLAEVLVLSIVPSFVIPLISPAVDGTYAAGDVLVHGVCFFIGVTVFFSLAFLLSTVFTDLWRPLLIALGAAMVLSFVNVPWGVFQVMRAESWFRGGGLPWGGIVVSVIASAGLLYGSALNFARRDF